MNEYCRELLNSLSIREYRSFLQNAIGLQMFIMGDENRFYIEKIPKDTKVKKDNRYRIGKRGGDSKSEEVTYYAEEIDYKNKTFRDQHNNLIEVNGYFENIPEYYLVALILAARGVNRLWESNIKVFNTDFVTSFGRSSFRLFNKKSVQFILGAGVNKDNALKNSIGEWNELIEKMRIETRIINSLPRLDLKPYLKSEPPFKVKIWDKLEDFESSICNASYISPQVLKGMNEEKYYYTLHNTLYDGYKKENLNRIINPDVADTSLFQIARILSERTDASKVLTFNYDELLETVFEYNFPNTIIESKYKYKRPKYQDAKVEIIHPHGFVDSNDYKDHHGIVLSTFEYLDAYKSKKSYARLLLLEQLEKPNILIGNSLSDYEEQKVFYEHNRNDKSSWHFLFLRRSHPLDQWMDIYKILYFFNMGVIPVFFGEFSEMTDCLKLMY